MGNNAEFVGHNEVFAGHNAVFVGHNDVFAGHNNVLVGHNNVLVGHNNVMVGHNEVLVGHNAVFVGRNLSPRSTRLGAAHAKMNPAFGNGQGWCGCSLTGHGGMDGPSRRGYWPIVKLALGALAYASVCASALAVGAGFRWVQKSPLLMEALKSPVTDRFSASPFEGLPAVTLLILGCDQELTYRGTKVLNKYARSDMMMVVRIDFDGNRIGGLSIPRDTVVAAPGYRSQKINGYHVLGGADLSRQAVETLLPVSIDRVVVIDFDAFQQMVDLVGGVEVYVPKRMKHTDKAAKLYIDLQPGRQVLNGYDSMCFVRYRKTDDDFKRTERQRDFLLAFKQAVMRNPIKLPEVANKGKEVLGDALNDREIIHLAKFAQSVGNDNIKVGMVPVLDVPGSKTFDLEVDDGRIQETLRQFHMVPEDPAYLPTTP